MDEQAEEVLFEAWFYKLKSNGGQAKLRLSSAWIKRYCILRRIDDRAVLQYHKEKPNSLDENPKNRYELWPSYKIEKHRNLNGKPFVIFVTTSVTKLTLATEDESMFDLFAFFLQTQTQLLELDNSSSTFVVRPENSLEHLRLGSRGSMCVLHVCEWGVILALELSRCVIAFWPLKSIKFYEASGKGQFGLEIGKNSTTGPGTFMFNTRLSQDIAIYNMLDEYVNAAVELRQSTEAINDLTMAGEYKKLQQFTVANSDSRFTSQLKKISRNIHDPFLEIIGGTSQRRQGTSAYDETTLTGRKTASERSNNSQSETPPPARPPAFDFEGRNSKLHRTPPPAYHRYSNDEMEDGATKISAEDRYLVTNARQNHSNGHEARKELSFDGTQTVPKSRGGDESSAAAGVTAALPFNHTTTWPRLHRLASRSAEDLSEHTRAANMYAYNNGSFQRSDAASSVYSEDRDSESGHIIYSYAIPAELVPQQLVRQRSKEASHSPTLGRVRRSMSNPNILGSQLDQLVGSQLDQLVPPDQYDEMQRPELPVRPTFLNIKRMGPADAKAPTSIEGISQTSKTRAFRKIPDGSISSTSPEDNVFLNNQRLSGASSRRTSSTSSQHFHDPVQQRSSNASSERSPMPERSPNLPERSPSVIPERANMQPQITTVTVQQPSSFSPTNAQQPLHVQTANIQQPPMLTRIGPRGFGIPGFPAGRQESSQLFQFLQASRMRSPLPFNAPEVFHTQNNIFDSNVTPVTNAVTIGDGLAPAGNHVTTISTQRNGTFSSSESYSWNSQFQQVQANDVSPSRDLNKNITVEKKMKSSMDETLC